MISGPMARLGLIAVAVRATATAESQRSAANSAAAYRSSTSPLRGSRASCSSSAGISEGETSAGRAPAHP